MKKWFHRSDRTFLSLPLLWFSSWIDVLIFLGYTGVLTYAILIWRRFISKPQKPKYLLPEEKEYLTRTREDLQHMVPFIIVMGILGFGGVWYLHGKFPGKFVHLLILMAVYLILLCIDFSLKDKATRSPPSREMPRKPGERKYLTSTYEKILYVNAVALYVFCILYARSRFDPFHSIWGIITWIFALAMTYPAVLWFGTSLEFYFGDLTELTEDSKYKSKRIAISKGLIPLSSWIMAFFFLRFGLLLQ